MGFNSGFKGLSTQRTSPEGYGQPHFLVCFCARATTYVPPCIGTGVRIVPSALPPPLPPIGWTPIVLESYK